VSTFLHHDDAPPPHGIGHYSEDGRRWFDERSRRWLHVRDQHDTLVIELQDVEIRLGWRAALRAGLRTTRPASWFIGHASSEDPRWPTYWVEGCTFSRMTAPEESLTPAAAEALSRLEVQLEAEGWRLVDQGETPWSLRYERPVVERVSV
jgi:hypothetical protein